MSEVSFQPVVNTCEEVPSVLHYYIIRNLIFNTSSTYITILLFSADKTSLCGTNTRIINKSQKFYNNFNKIILLTLPRQHSFVSASGFFVSSDLCSESLSLHFRRLEFEGRRGREGGMEGWREDI